MKRYIDVYQQLRNRLLGDLHIGRVQPGDRLPSMREVARQTGADHRVVARAYRALAEDGLVEVRGRSGITVAGGDGDGAGVVVEAERTRWLSGILEQAWTQRLPLHQLPDLLHRVVRPLRCACVESTEDHEVAICAEIEEDFGLVPRPVRLDDDPAGNREVLEHVLAEVDMVVTTAFHASEVAPVASQLRKPLVVVTVNPQLRERLVEILVHGDVIVVIADEGYMSRARAHMRGFEEGVHYRFVLAEDADVNAVLSAPSRALVTRAARRRLGLEGLHLFSAGDPFLSEQTAREIAAAIVRINLAAERTTTPD
jgi:DNA-binding transcriptional regulator YhcF (GntR family)